MGTLGTALITGASSGIGEAYARHLAVAGYDLVLVARREDRLKELAATYIERFGVAVETIQADLLDDEDIARVISYIEAADNLTMLVNNAGFSRVGFFADLPLQSTLDMLKLHVEVTMRLSHAALPKMREAQYGTIINVASMGAFMGMPKNATYNATKAFLMIFSDGISYELDDDNIQIQVICPGFTRTDIFDLAGLDTKALDQMVPWFAWMTPDEVVTESLGALARKKRILIPGYFNRIYWALMVFPPTGYILKMLTKGAKSAE